jgi:transposase
MRGKKGVKHRDPSDPPRRRANKQKGHGTYQNDRPPIIGTVGRDSDQVRLRVAKHTNSKTLKRHLAQFTLLHAVANTNEWNGYNQIECKRVTVNHGEHEWARDDDGDGIREVHINTTEGMWTGTRNFLRPFRGVNKDHLSGYVAMCEHSINLKSITPGFIAALVGCT